MSSEVTICNIALARLGQTQITSLTEADKKARLCLVFYEPMRDAVLQDAWWTFATKRQTLSQLVATPDSGFDYYYQLPADCLDPRYLENDLIEYVIEGDKLITDSTEDIELVYTQQLTDTTLFSPNFVDALAYRIAAELAMSLTNDLKKHDQLLNIYASIVAQASAHDKRTRKRKVTRHTGWVSMRKGSTTERTKKLTSET